MERMYILFGNQPVLIYTSRKVGSTSIYLALKKIIGPRVLFAHWMTQETIDIYNRPFLQNNIKPHRHNLAIAIKKNIIDKNKPLSIISVIREPILRNISCFFQDFPAYNGSKQFDEISVEEAIENFIQFYPHDMADRWFNQEFLKTLGMGIEDVQFDIDKKRGQFDYKNYKILLFRIDLEDTQKEKHLSHFLQIPPINLKIKNAHYQKKYHFFYLEFLKRIRFPNFLIEEIYSHPYLKVFYSDEELINFQQQWYDKML